MKDDGILKLDLNSKTKINAIPHKLIKIINDSILESEGKKEKRWYLGASYIGDTCKRKIQYQFFNAKRDSGNEISARIFRIFERGHVGEGMMAKWMCGAGFILDGSQAGFSVLGGLFSGHCDGIIKSGHKDLSPYPRLWECKVLGDKSWKKLNGGGVDGLKKNSPAYYGQIQIYQAYLDITENPALFTALNADTMDILAIDVPFNSSDAQELSDKAVMIIKACQAGEKLPRMNDDPDYWECRFCGYKERCHAVD
jgi:hypothetical protein